MQLHRGRWPGLVMLALVLSASALRAQPAADPFAAIVGDPDGANAALNDVSLPVRNPTEDELRQYLAAFQVLNASATVTLDDGRGRRAEFRTPSPVAFGPFSAPNGTKVRIAGGFEKRRGENEAVLRTLEITPDRDIDAMGLARFQRAYLDDKGVMHFQAKAALIGRQEVTVEKVYRDRDGLLRFKLSGDGLGGVIFSKGLLGGEIRVRPDGKLERWSRGFLGLNLISTGWEPIMGQDGKQVQVPFLAGIKSWPPKASELVDMFPMTGPAVPPPGGDPLAAARAALDVIPVSALELRFQGKADPKVIRLSGGEGQLLLSDHQLELLSNGRFKGRTYHTDPGLPNSYRLTGTVTGEVARAGTHAKLDRVHFDLQGTHAETIPFEDPTQTVLDAALKSALEVQLSDVRTELPDGTWVVIPGQARGAFQGEGSLTLRPLGAQDRSELRIDRRKNHYDLTVNGPVEVGGLGATPGPASLPKTMRLAPFDVRPVLHAEGTLGTKMGFLFTKTEIDLEGKTETPGAIGILEGTGAGRREVKTTLKPGASVKVHLYTFAGVKQSSLEGLVASALGSAPAGPLEMGAVNATVDARIKGEAADTVVNGPEMDVRAPASRIEARLASSVRLGTRNGAEAEVRAVAAETRFELTQPAEMEAGLPGMPRLKGTAGAGTRLSASTGEMKRDPRTGVLSSQTGRLEAHLVLTQGSLAFQGLALALQGRAEVDLTAAIGFKLDPRGVMAGQPLDVREPMDLDLALTVQLAPGTVLRGQQAGSQGEVRLRGATSVTVHAKARVEPDSGRPTLGSLTGVDLSITADGVDLQALLAPLGNSVTASTSGRSTVKLRQASFEMLPDGALRIRHQGLSVELAPGELVIRPTTPARPRR